jgi:hypothetical protein
VARGLGQGISTGSNYWVIYGLGGAVTLTLAIELVMALAGARKAAR